MYHAGDIVARISHQQDIYFYIVKVTDENQGERMAIIKGLNLRLLADAPLSDLVTKSPTEVMNYEREDNKMIYKKLHKLTSQRKSEHDDAKEYFEIPGRVLQLDGDQDYLNQCIRTYRQMGIEAKGICKSEIEQPKVIRKVLEENPTDILVLTGHDGFLRGKKDFHSLDSYRSSRYFVESVFEARRFQPNRDGLVIFAGACQSNYEAILEAGANFASSPKRMLIHAFDPVFIVERIAFTPMDQIVSVKDILMHTITGTDGVGGIETRGQMRRGYPRSPY
ncbi:sporulation peptidase YabG [Desulfosporosinus acidiphilus SJ4]|uniref:Sporulation peptidase YabG n=1 Tax=Desulfosporosinus acidiphilus (strain DSM 22704 / JCM 16185 / SJ4) TaxID=646529 RepID=I4D039_DESAJ|nr:sporulation peptidase YabG [Desulfosporosinus acidiphilus]AFM39163.1 sporulation peptidase YabG [Desulfosporosinus acidiphilus SJ4]